MKALILVFLFVVQILSDSTLLIASNTTNTIVIEPAGDTVKSSDLNNYLPDQLGTGAIWIYDTLLASVNYKFSA